MNPNLSVVVPSVTGWPDLKRCVAALQDQEGNLQIEVIIPERLGTEVQRQVKEAFPACVLIPQDQKTTIPLMRGAAIQMAKAPAVAVLEDHVIVPSNWAEVMLKALAESDGVVAGSVENGATTTLMDRAAFLCEYSHCMPPIPAGEVDWLTGNNVVYQRKLLLEHAEIYQSGQWENVLHDAIKASGKRLICHPEIVVSHDLHYGPFDYLGQRYLYARSYAGSRVVDESGLKKFLYGCAAFLLPPILLFRIFKRVFDKNRDRGVLLASIPLLISFVFAWSWGEVIGYWFGAGDSLSRVR